LNEDKWPRGNRLKEMWEENMKAFVEYPLALSMRGLKGRIFTDDEKPVALAVVHIIGQGYNVTSGMMGDYYRSYIMFFSDVNLTL
jgi:hypothetical protein